MRARGKRSKKDLPKDTGKIYTSKVQKFIAQKDDRKKTLFTRAKGEAENQPQG